MKKTVKTLILTGLSLLIAAASFGCAKAPIEEDFLVYNNTDHILTMLCISDTESPAEDENAIILFNLESPLAMRQNANMILEIPAELHDKELYIYLDAYGAGGIEYCTVPAGKMFQDGIWGIEIEYDENGSITIDLLDDLDI